jgi:hypothetical protein
MTVVNEFTLLSEAVSLLREIRDALVPPVEEETGECPHPEQARIDLAGFDNREHWICKACKYEHVAQ